MVYKQYVSIFTVQRSILCCCQHENNSVFLKATIWEIILFSTKVLGIFDAQSITRSVSCYSRVELQQMIVG